MANGVSKIYPTREASGAVAGDNPWSTDLSEVGGQIGDVIETPDGNKWMLVQADAALLPCRLLEAVSIEKTAGGGYGQRISFEVGYADAGTDFIVGVSPNFNSNSSATTIDANAYFWMGIEGIFTVEGGGSVTAITTVESGANGIAANWATAGVKAGLALETDETTYTYAHNSLPVFKMLFRRAELVST